MFVSFLLVKRMSLKLVTFDDHYLNHLLAYESKVRINHGDHKRPYVGVALWVNNIPYFVPLGHPSEKYKNMHNYIDFLKIENGRLGVLNFNNMIPATIGAIHVLNINGNASGLSDSKYNHLLQNQTRWLLRNQGLIQTKAKRLHDLYCIDKLEDDRVKERCCNFTVLEKACIEYGYKLNDLQQLPDVLEPDRLYLAVKPVLDKYYLIDSFDFSDKGYEEGISWGLALHRDFVIFGINSEQEGFIYQRDMFEKKDPKTFDEAFMTSPAAELCELEKSIGKKFEVMNKSPFLLR